MKWHWSDRNAANDNTEVDVAYTVMVSRTVYVARFEYIAISEIYAPNVKLLVGAEDKEKLLPLLGRRVKVTSTFEVIEPTPPTEAEDRIID